MRLHVLSSALLVAAAWPRCRRSQQQAAGSTVKTNVDEVLLDLIVRDKKGKPMTDLKPEESAVLDNGAKQTITSFPPGAAARRRSTSSGATTPLDPLRQIRLVTLAFEAMTAADQRKLARTAAIDLIKGDQGTNVYYSVVVINTRLLVLQQFTKDKDALTKAIERATGGVSGPARFRIGCHQAELRRNLGGQNGADQPGNLLAAATQTAVQAVNNGSRCAAGEAGPGDAGHAAHGCGRRRRMARASPLSALKRAGGRPADDARPQIGHLLHHGNVAARRNWIRPFAT